MTTALTPTDRTTLAACEATIARGLQTFTEVGHALARIKTEKLYRADYDSFEAYCKARWGFARAHAYRLIDAAKVVENVSPIGDIPKESQARELARLPADQQQDAWQEVIEETDGRPTAAAVRETVERRLRPKPEPIEPEVIEAGPCPHGGDHDFQGDHCTKCFEPAPDAPQVTCWDEEAEAEARDAEPKYIGEFKAEFLDLVNRLRMAREFVTKGMIGDWCAEVLGEIE
jgi:hypothetical protein